MSSAACLTANPLEPPLCAFEVRKGQVNILPGPYEFPDVQLDEEWWPIGERPLFGINCKRAPRFGEQPASGDWIRTAAKGGGKVESAR